MHRHAGAKQRRHFNRRKPLGNLQGVARRGFQKLCEATVHGHSGNLLPQTKVFIAFLAECALTASPVNPGYAGAVTNLQIANGGASPDNAAGDLVAEDEGFLDNGSKLRPISIGQMQIGVTDAAGFDLDENLVGFQFRPRNLLEHQRFPELLQNRGLHAHLGGNEAISGFPRGTKRKGASRAASLLLPAGPSRAAHPRERTPPRCAPVRSNYGARRDRPPSAAQPWCKALRETPPYEPAETSSLAHRASGLLRGRPSAERTRLRPRAASAANARGPSPLRARWLSTAVGRIPPHEPCPHTCARGARRSWHRSRAPFRGAP